MPKLQFTKLVWTIIALCTVAAGCTTTGRHYDQRIDAATGKPQWVLQGTQTSKSIYDRIFWGVGEADASGEFSRQADAANQRAKDELQKMVERFIEVISRDYIASGGAAQAGFLEHQATRYINEMTGIVLPEIKIMEHWVDQGGRKIFAIAELEYTRMVSLLAGSSQVNPGFKDYLQSKGESVFDHIATQH
ncbi:MAG: hypothetical protein L0Z73_15765 [Gammaproteobacteria bacterium]|nr:hypothetical protein [Gammaproteobacteria bacterium]